MDKGVKLEYVGTPGKSVIDKKGAFQRAQSAFRNWITGNISRCCQIRIWITFHVMYNNWILFMSVILSKKSKWNLNWRFYIEADGSSGFKAESGRYHLYVSFACPWAHRTLIVRKLKGLEDVISVNVVDWLLNFETGWEFNEKVQH